MGAYARRQHQGRRGVANITTRDGVRLAYEEAGSGFPMIFVHEFAGDIRSWEPQMRFFSRRYRCIAYAARGYLPSDVPEDPGSYSQDHATDDIASVLGGLGISHAHVVGLSMGAFATLHFGMRYGVMARSLVAAGVGYGAAPDKREQFRAESEATARRIQAEGMAKVAAGYAVGPTRLPFAAKDPRGHAEFMRQLAEHSTLGSALTMLGVQRLRPGLWDLRERLAAIEVPVLVLAGDEDEPTLEPALFLKRTIQTSAVAMLPRTGHTMNLEEPDAFNDAVLRFVSAVEAGAWKKRDPRIFGGSILGMR
jgi:pimeloyl-ACP methyl ester carboxylesterase